MSKKEIKIVYKNVDELIPYVNNPRDNSGAIDAVASSIKNFGFKVPIVVDKDCEIVTGHTRLLAAKKLGMDQVPVIVADDLSEAEIKAFRLADNKVAELAEWDWSLLDIEIEELKNMDLDFDLEEFGFEDLDDDFMTTEQKIGENDYTSPLNETFLVNPFSVINTMSGDWQNRKNMWLDKGIKSEVGRDEALVLASSMNVGNLKGTSIFDPVLCEVGYRWFSPGEGGLIFDPFAGGSVRGIVAEQLGFKYTGIDLRSEQIEANIENAKEIGCDLSKINWINDNSLNMDKHIKDESADLVFTCPPYFDLEVYSDNPEDISNMDYDEFAKIYTEILEKSAAKLKNNRFAIVVISDVRDKEGFYRGLCELTKDAYKSAGMKLYNELILYNSIASAGMRARRNMRNRKVVKVHQNVLVFFKGDPKSIQKEFPELEIIEDIEDEEIA